MNIDEAEKAYMEALDKSMGCMNRGDWYKRRTVRRAFRNGWTQAIKQQEVKSVEEVETVEEVKSTRYAKCHICGDKIAIKEGDPYWRGKGVHFVGSKACKGTYSLQISEEEYNN